MRPQDLARSVAQAAIPDQLTRYMEDRIRGIRFDMRARTYRAQYGFEPAARRLTLLTYPESIATFPRILLGRLCAALGYRVTAIPERRYDVAFKFEDATFTNPEVLNAVRTGCPVINGASLDISKTSVDREYEAVFGSSTLLDPEAHDGPLVEKPNINSAHGRCLVEGPLPAKPGFVYQRLIDSTTDDGHYIEYRMPFHDGRFPLVYRKEVDETTRFAKETARVTIEHPGDHFSPEELRGIRQICTSMGLDFGELDVLRDRHDGRPYLIDVNNTPWGPLKGLTEKDHAQAIRVLAASFQQMCESRLDA